MRTQGNTKTGDHVQLYHVEYSQDGVTYITTGETMRGLNGNIKVARLFRDIFTARYVRILPLTWFGHIELRADVLLCACPSGQFMGELLPADAAPDEEEGFRIFRLDVTGSTDAHTWCIKELRLFNGVKRLGTRPSGASASSFRNPAGPGQAFDDLSNNNLGQYCSAVGENTGWIQYSFNSTVEVSSYMIEEIDIGGRIKNQQNPTMWRLLASNGGDSWTILDTQGEGHSPQSWNGRGERKIFLASGAAKEADRASAAQSTLGSQVVHRPNVGGGRTYNFLDLDMKFRGSGRVTKWKFESARAGTNMRLQVWRPSVGTANHFTLLCENYVTSTIGHNELVISDEDACRFARGDVVGWWVAEELIKWGKTGDDHQIRWQYTHHPPTVAKQIGFGGADTRSYSIEATAIYDDATVSVCSECGNHIDGEYRCAAGDHTSGNICDGSTQFDSQTCDRCPNQFGMGMPNYQCAANYFKTGSVCTDGWNNTQTCQSCGNSSLGYGCPVDHYQTGGHCDGAGTTNTQSCAPCTDSCPGSKSLGPRCDGSTAVDRECREVDIVTSAHRVWIGESVVKQGASECFEVTLSVLDLGSAKFMPMAIFGEIPAPCDDDHGSAKQKNWDKFHLKFERGRFYSATALPGQTVLMEMMRTEGGAQTKISKRLRTKCGCMDYPALAAAKNCSTVVGCDEVSCLPAEEGAAHSQPLDCVSTVAPDLASENFHWRTDSTGRPGGFSVTQREGTMLFRWTDSSQCETAFEITRDGTSFADDFLHDSEQTCGQTVEPEAIYDDLRVSLDSTSGYRLPGTPHQYCIAAVATVGAGAAANAYASNSACVNVRVKMESIILGSVLMKSEPHLGVPGVVVSYRVHSTGETKSVTSGPNGEFKLHFLLDTASQAEAVTLFYSKISEGFHHLFDCAGLSCGPGTDANGIPYPPARQTITVEHMQLARPLEVFETSSVSFSGKVSFPQIDSPYATVRGGAIPTGWPWGQHIAAQCYLSDIEVCLLDFTSNEVMVCAVTEKDGSYSLNAPVGMHVYARVTSSRNSEEHYVRSASSKVDDMAVRSGFVTAKIVGKHNVIESTEGDKYNTMRAKEESDESVGTVFTPNSNREIFFIDPHQPDIWRGESKIPPFVTLPPAPFRRCNLLLGDN